MKTRDKLFETLLCVAALTLWVSTPGFTQQQEEHGEELQEEEHHEGGHASEGDIPEHADEIVAEILAQDLLIQHFIETGLLTQIHQPAFKARDLAEALEQRDQGLAPEDQKKVVAAIRRIVSTAKELDKYGDAEDATKTKITYRAFETAILEFKSLYPDITPSHYWTCAMHADVWKAESGQCPKCNHEMMLIVKHYEGQAAHHEDEEHHDEHDDDHRL